jgi:DNA-binding CsgD family transcriptional regulator
MMQVRRAHAWFYVQSGELGRGLALLHEAVEEAAARGEIGMETIILHDLARLGESLAVATRLSELAEGCEGALIAARAAHAVASAAADAHGLERAAAEFARIGALLFAAEAGTEAAQLHGRAGNRRARAACERQAGDWLGRCEGARTPAVSLAETISLTRREREVAALAARGVPSRAIAERLHINVRTVGNHLQRVYDKLGVSSRTGLAEALGTDPDVDAGP